MKETNVESSEMIYEHDIIKSFQPMPKRFMVWDKKQSKFRKNDITKEMYFDIVDLAVFLTGMGLYNGEDPNDFTIVQSTNLFDKDGKEIFEGSIVEDSSSGSRWLVFIDVGKILIKRGGAVRHYGYISWQVGSEESRETNIKNIGHILSNPELLEEEIEHEIQNR